MKTAILLAAALFAVVGQASAVSIDTTVTPANVKGMTYPPLAVNVNDAKGMKRFEVVVKGKAGEEAQFLQGASLTVKKGGRKVAVCPVAQEERKGDVVFSFEVSPDHLDGSDFRVTYIAHVKMKDRQGKEKWVGMPSANFLTFPLQEFAKAQKAR
jgi:hypothetical protein